jgi:hypothetical protein
MPEPKAKVKRGVKAAAKPNVPAKKKPSKSPAKKKKKIALAPTRLIFLLDVSGSMSVMAREAIGGFNNFVESQREVPGEATLSLILFDDRYEIIHDEIDLEEVPELTSRVYVPRGMTALYDAVGRTIKNRLVADMMSKQPKNQKTIVAILTDGMENASREFTWGTVKNVMTEAQDNKGWEVIFVGANMDAHKVAGSMGIKASNTTTFDYTKAGTADVLRTVAFASTALRGVDACIGGETYTSANLNLDNLYGAVKKERDQDPTET